MAENQKTDAIKPENSENFKKAVNLGNELSKNPDLTKADITRQMYQFIGEEKREVIAQAFIEGANLTPKGAMTYVYNVRRWYSLNKK